MSQTINRLIRWEPFIGDSWLGYVGRIQAGMIVRVKDGPNAGKWSYTVDGIATRGLVKSRGYVRSDQGAKTAIRRAWAAWLIEAGLA